MAEVLKKSILLVIVILIYFLGIREIRKGIHDLYMGTVLPAEYGEINENYSFYSQSSVSFTICDECVEYGKGWQFKIPFGSYWLFGTLALILIGARKEDFLVLGVIHLLAGLLTLIFVVIGLRGNSVFIISTDFICRYLLPLFSMGYAALVFGKLKSKASLDE